MVNKEWLANRLQPLRVLLVEDDPAEAEVLDGLLRGEAHGDTRVDLARSLSGALDYLQAHTYDLILLNLTLPDARGVTLFQGISERVPDVPIVILTSLADFSLAMKVFPMGAHDYLIKDELEGRLLARVLSQAVERRMAMEVDWRVLERFQKYQKGASHSLVRELVDTYTSIAPQRVEALQQAMREGGTQEVRRLAHQLKGAAASVGAVAVAAAAGRLEVAPDQPILVESLGQEVRRSLLAFRERLAPVP